MILGTEEELDRLVGILGIQDSEDKPEEEK
jgi:hypothetical protein